MLGSYIFIITNSLKQPVLSHINVPGFPFLVSLYRVALLGHSLLLQKAESLA